MGTQASLQREREQLVARLNEIQQREQQVLGALAVLQEILEERFGRPIQEEIAENDVLRKRIEEVRR